MNSVLVQFLNATKKFGDDVVFEDLKMEFFAGETHVICGPSGVGKSTLLRCINYLEPLSDGKVLFSGIPVNRKTALKIRKDVSMVFQQFNLWPHLTALENAILGPVKVLKQPRRKAIEAAQNYFERVGLAEKMQSFPYQLSGGQAQRVAIVRALCIEPRLIMFDEPTAALDPEMIGEVLKVIKDLADEGRSMIIVSHEMGFAREAAHKISFMCGGQIVETKAPDEFFNNPKNQALRRFLAQIL